jgi:hypothetical protein
LFAGCSRDTSPISPLVADANVVSPDVNVVDTPEVKDYDEEERKENDDEKRSEETDRMSCDEVILKKEKKSSTTPSTSPSFGEVIIADVITPEEGGSLSKKHQQRLSTASTAPSNDMNLHQIKLKMKKRKRNSSSDDNEEEREDTGLLKRKKVEEKDQKVVNHHSLSSSSSTLRAVNNGMKMNLFQEASPSPPSSPAFNPCLFSLDSDKHLKKGITAPLELPEEVEEETKKEKNQNASRKQRIPNKAGNNNVISPSVNENDSGSSSLVAQILPVSASPSSSSSSSFSASTSSGVSVSESGNEYKFVTKVFSTFFNPVDGGIN